MIRFFGLGVEAAAADSTPTGEETVNANDAGNAGDKTDAMNTDAAKPKYNAVGAVMGMNTMKPMGCKAAKKLKYSSSEGSLSGSSEQAILVKDLQKTTTLLYEAIKEKTKQERAKANQQSDMNLAMMYHKMGRTKESEYHMQMAAMRNERWRKAEVEQMSEQERKELETVIEGDGDDSEEE